MELTPREESVLLEISVISSGDDPPTLDPDDLVILQESGNILSELQPVTPVRAAGRAEPNITPVTPSGAAFTTYEAPHASTPHNKEATTSTSGILSSSTRSSGEKKSKKFSCMICPYRSHCKSNVMRHQRARHGGAPPSVCGICNKEFRSAYYLKQHIQNHASPRVCEFCSKTFSTKNGLKFHKRNVHLLTGSYECPFCNKSFQVKINYEGHVNAHRDYKPFKCQTCNKCFSYKSSLSFHSQYCSITPRYVCATCSAQFRTKTLLNQHSIGKHSQEIFRCICGKTFSWRTSMLRHQRQRNCK